MEHKKIGFYNYTVVLTYCGMLLAFTGILQVLEGYFRLAVLSLMLSGTCDMFDGTVAATKKDRSVQEKRFGIQIDSLSDLISFGVFPGLFVYEFSGKNRITGVIVGIYILAALVRLAYYNVLAEEKQERGGNEKEAFLGVPVTTIAIVLPAMFILADHGILNSGIPFVVMLAVVAIGFVTPVVIKKPKTAGKIVILALGAAEMLMLILKSTK